MFVFYGAVRSGPATNVPYPQVLRITAPGQGTSHGILVWAGTGAGIKPSQFNSGEWEVTFTRGELNKSNYGGTDTTTNTVTAIINRTTGSIRFVYLKKGYVVEGANCYMQEYQHGFRMFPTGEDAEGRLVTDGSPQYTVEFVPPELFESETAFTDPPEGTYTYMEALEESESGGNTMADVNEILVKSYLNLERDPVNDYHAASKNYVDTSVGGVNSSLTTHTGSTSIHVPAQNTAGYVFLSNTTATSPGTWTAYGTAGTDVASGGTKLVTGGAVYAYLNSHYSAFTDKSLVTSVANNNANPVTSGAVYTYVQNTVLNKSGTTGATALASTDDTKVPSSKLVAEYVSAQISAAASDYAGSEHKHSGADITSGTVAAARLPSASASAKGIVQVGSGLAIATTGDDNGKLTVDLGEGLTQDSDGAVTIQLQSNSGLSLNANGLKVDTSSIKGDIIGTTQGKAPALDSAGKLSIDVMPARVIGGEYLGEVATQAAMIAKSNATVGDFVKRTDTGTYWMLGVDGANSYNNASNWFEYAGAVSSVNGNIGAVTLDAAAVSAIATADLVTTVASTSVDTKVPSALAVYTFVNGNYAPKTHNHNASAINAGTLAADRLPAATTSAKGAVIVGTGLKVSSGTISADFLAASNGVYDTTNTTKPITAAAAKTIAEAAASSATAAAAKGKIFTITGDGSKVSFTCTHGLGISNVLVQVYDSTGKQVLVAIEKDTTTVTFKFATAPASGATYTAVILGVQEAS